jgi:cell wall-associated NlpC family hydrolase
LVFVSKRPGLSSISYRFGLAVVICCVLALGVLVSCGAMVAEAVQTTKPYVVKSGDNLWNIARAHNSTVNAIMQASGLGSDRLSVGQKLLISLPAQTTPVGGALILARSASSPEVESTSPGNPEALQLEYIVCAGDTLWSIAARYGVTVNGIKLVNGLPGDMLIIGQRLLLPNSVTNSIRSDLSTLGTEVSRSGDRVQNILSYARTLLGTPYRMGGTTAAGFDCSGFASHVFDHFGITLPRASDAQYRVGTTVERGDLRPGDLVFFTTYAPGASHVGIYVGNNQFIHSSSPRSGGVIYTAMGDSYYSSRYLGARRIVP